MAQCIHHPDYPAIEFCESCRVPLCGQCLWYAESGQRLCERCARAWQEAGHTVYEPEQFAAGIQPTLTPPTTKPEPRGAYSGNTADLVGLIAACLGGVVFLYCVPCLSALAPLLGLILGLYALSEAKHAVNPGRTQVLGGIGIIGGLLVLVLGMMWLGITVFMPLMLALFASINP